MSEVYGTRILVTDFGASVRFYRDIVGLAARSKDVAPPYVELFGGERFVALFDRSLMAAALPSGLRTGPAGDAVVLGFEVPDVDRECERLAGLGVDLEARPADRPDWRLRTAHLRDPDGNLVEIFQRTD